MVDSEKEEYELLLPQSSRERERICDNDEEENPEHDHHLQQRIHWPSNFRSRSFAEIFQLETYQSARFPSLSNVLRKWTTAITVLSHVESLVPRSRKLYSRRSLIATALSVLSIALIVVPMALVLLVLLYGGRPPLYTDFRAKERALPQHKWGSSSAENEGVSEGAFRNIRSPVNGKGRAGNENVSIITGEYQERYLRFPDHLWGHGLNNVLQEALLYALIAHTANRSYVFEDFVWSHIPLPYTLYDFSLRPTRIPMSAFFGGWIVGQGVEALEGDESLSGPPIVRVLKRTARDLVGLSGRQVQVRRSSRPPSKLAGTTPTNDLGDELDVLTRASTSDETRTQQTRGHRSISAEYFEHVCPTSERVEVVYSAPSPQNTAYLSYSEVSAPDDSADGAQILHWWTDRLNHDDVRNERCVVIRERGRRIWDSNFFGTTRPLSLFPLLRSSPVLHEFRWSSLVENVVERTIETFFSRFTPQNLSTNDRPPTSAGKADGLPPHSSGASASKTQSRPDRQLTSIPRVLAVHLRRGDYKRHCMRLAHWGAGYMGWNRLIYGDDDYEVGFEEGLKLFLEEQSHADYGPSDEDGYGRDPEVVEKEKEKRRETYYLRHCLPSIPQIVERLAEVRRQHHISTLGVSRGHSERSRTPSSMVKNESANSTMVLKEVYVLTNGWPSFVDELRSALLADGWEKVVASVDVERGWSQNDIEEQQALQGMVIHEVEDFAGEQILATTMVKIAGLNKEEKGVSAAIDMGLAERAEVFVGNGFSSLSANVIMLRLAKGLPLKSNYLL